MSKTELETLLPHRDPMLLLDEAELAEGPEGPEAHGRVAITGEEFFVRGHFPGNPVVPGVIQCEMLAQACCVLLADSGLPACLFLCQEFCSKMLSLPVYLFGVCAQQPPPFFSTLTP